jgi:AraC family transcriptional regulator, alkane utilization regulator
MDALSEVLRHARFAANVTLDASAHEPWCVSVPAAETMGRAHVVVEGECMVRTAHGDEATLRAGDLVFLPGGESHLVGSTLEADATPLSSLVRTPIDGELLPVRLGRHGARTHLISLAFTCERHMAEPLLAALPRLVFVDLTGAPPLEWLTDELGLVLSASDAPFLGASATRARLAELLFIEALARYVQSLPPGGQGWLAGLNDRYVGRALALVHGRPSEPWTVERLGRLVGLSRSALAERFSQVMGEPIFAFLTRWRLQLAAESLLATRRTIESIAGEAGYESAGAFSAAFKRAFGKPPSLWRRKRRK